MNKELALAYFRFCIINKDMAQAKLYASIIKDNAYIVKHIGIKGFHING